MQMQESTSYKDLVSSMESNFTLKQIFFVLKMQTNPPFSNKKKLPKKKLNEIKRINKWIK